MGLRLEVNGEDFTARWRLYESRWTSRAYKGESFQSEFVIDDDGSISHADLASRKIVTVWEDASGSDVCLYRGRIANKVLGRPRVMHGNDMVWRVTTEDSNIDLRGLRVHQSTRSEETDDVRVEAYRLGYLNGASSTNPRARDSTTMGDAIVSANLVTLESTTYDATDPFGVFQDIIDYTGKTFFVYVDDAGDMQLYYADHTDTSYSSDIEVVDTDHLTVDGVDVYAADLTPNAGDHNGQDVISGAGVDTPHGYYELSDLAGAEAFHDKWEEHMTDDRVRNQSEAEALIIKYQGSKSNEDFAYHSTFLMTADNVHRLKAGMMVPLTRWAADKGTSTEQRAVQVSVAPRYPDEDGNAVYEVTAEYGVPRGTPFRRRFNRPIPKPPAPTTPAVPGTCTRYYLTTDITGVPTVARDSSWDKGNGENGMSWRRGLLQTTHPGSNGTATWGLGTIGVPLNFVHGQFFLELGAGDVTGTVRAIIKAKRRTGTGVTSAQRHQAQMVIRVVSADGTTVRGTVLDDHSPGTLDSGFFQSTQQTIKFPASSQWSGDLGAALTPVTAQAGDWLVVEVGSHTTIDGGGTGASLQFVTEESVDLPLEEFSTDTGNTWIDICTAGTAEVAGDEPEPVGTTPSPGTTTDTFAPIDHVHGHGEVAYDGTIDHEAASIEYDNTDSSLTAETVQDALDELASGAASSAVVDHGTMGATEEFDFSAGADHEGTLDENLTVTLTGAVADEAAWMTLVLTQDGTGTNTIDLPVAVVNAADVEAAFDTTADAVNILSIFTYDGGTSYYAFLAGGSGTLGAEDVSIADAGGYYTGTDVEAALQEVGASLASGGGGGAGELLISDTPSTPLVFADILQNEAQDDPLYEG